MSGKDPSPGYSILAAALAANPPRHNVVITTNFDNLVADALAIYTDTFPFACGHESLTTFVRAAMRRPLICKIHRDLLLGPQNDPRSLRRLHDAWGTALRALVQQYTPIFIGYGGNDDTLMDLFESLSPNDIKGQMLWCYFEQQEPSQRIVDLIAEHKGVLVPVPDFDLLMVLLGEQMKIGLFDNEIELRAKERAQRYRERILDLDTVSHPSVAKSLAATFERAGGWWAWEQKARNANSPEQRDTIYKQGLEQFHESIGLLNNYAVFLRTERKDIDGAEALYKRAIEADPKHATALGNYANLLYTARKDFDGAEVLYKRAIEADPKHAPALGNYANILYTVRKDFDGAEALYKRAIEADPKHADNLGNYANFLCNARKDFDGAEALYKRAIEADPKHAPALGNYANLLYTVRKDFDGAEVLYKRAIEADPKHAPALGNYANLLYTVRKDFDGAEALYKRVIEADPKDANNLGNYAQFLFSIGDIPNGLLHLQQAISLLKPSSPPGLNAELWFYAYAHYSEAERREALTKLKMALAAGSRSPGWNFETDIERALSDNHPAGDWLRKLAAVICDGVSIETLNEWDEWKHVQMPDAVRSCH